MFFVFTAAGQRVIPMTNSYQADWYLTAGIAAERTASIYFEHNLTRAQRGALSELQARGVARTYVGGRYATSERRFTRATLAALVDLGLAHWSLGRSEIRSLAGDTP